MPTDDTEFTLPPDARLANPDLIRGVGFLRRGQPFETGDVDEAVFAKLCELVQNPWQPWACGGVHHCDLCRFTGNSVGTYYRKSASGMVQHPGLPVSAASSSVDLWVPGDGFLWVCPTSVTHYIDAHGFRPPEKFSAAVLRCPPMRSMEYLKAILANGGRELGFAGMTHKPPTPGGP